MQGELLPSINILTSIFALISNKATKIRRQEAGGIPINEFRGFNKV